MATPQVGIFLTDTQTASKGSGTTANRGYGDTDFSDQLNEMMAQYQASMNGTNSPEEGSVLPPEMNALMGLEGMELPEGLLSELQTRLQSFFEQLGDLESLTQEQLQQAYQDITQQIMDVSAEFGISLAPGSVMSWIQNLSQGQLTDAQTLFSGASGSLPTQLAHRFGNANASSSSANGQGSLGTDSLQNLSLDSLHLLKKAVQSQELSSSSVLDGLKSMMANTAATSMAISLEDITGGAHQAPVNLYSQPQNSAVEDAEVQLQRIPVPPTNRQFSQELGERIMIMASKNVQTAEIQLTPPELGSLMVKINIDNDQASIVFTSPNTSVRDALEQQSFRLREMLAEQGMEEVDVDVSDQQQDDSRAEEMLADMARDGMNSEEHDAEAFLESLDQQKVTTASMRLVDYYA
ncbi:flagellar hook-length control protein FliK [Litoribrevibacter euphylliae]|uniref:Flagellar hook-length control protein FliK n=1 Tax=Litoribrevibacter euphylliae TaxID=1834034 RepID=A0ABV7H7Y1_9GAMM